MSRYYVSPISPQSSDILFGKELSSRENGGNRLLRELVARRSAEYWSADRRSDYIDEGTKLDRQLIKDQIIAALREQGGRFLKRNKAGHWAEVSKKRAIARVNDEFGRPARKRRGTRCQEARGSIRTEREDGSWNAVAGDEVKTRSQGQEASKRPDERVSEVPEQDERVQAESLRTEGLSWTVTSSQMREHQSFEDLSSVVTASSSDVPGLSGGLLCHASVAAVGACPTRERSGPQPSQFHTGVPLSVIDEIRAVSSGVVEDIQSKLEELSAGITSEQKVEKVLKSLVEEEYSEHCEFDDIVADGGGLDRSGINDLLVAMSEYQSNERIQEYVSSMLCNLAANKYNKKLIAKEGGILLLVEAMGKFDGNERLQRHCCLALGNLALWNTCNADAIVELKGTDLIVQAMKKFSASESLQEFGCHALRNLVQLTTSDQRGQSNSDANKMTSVIVRAMRSFTNKQLHVYACAAIATFALDEANKEMIADSRALDAIKQGMQAFPSNEDVQLAGCLALAKLVEGCSDDVAGMVAPAIETIVKAMSVHVKNIGVQRFGTIALEHLSTHVMVTTKVLESRAITLILKSMRTFHDRLWFQKYSCLALGNMAVCPKTILAIANENGIGLVIKAMKSFASSLKPMQFGSFALQNLSRGREGDIVAKIVAEGGIQVLLGAMRNFPLNRELQGACCGALGNLAMNDRIFANAMGVNGDAVELVLKAIQWYQKGPFCETLLLVRACFCLESIGSASQECQREILDRQGVKLARDAWSSVLGGDQTTETKKWVTALKSVQNRFLFDDALLA